MTGRAHIGSYRLAKYTTTLEDTSILKHITMLGSTTLLVLACLLVPFSEAFTTSNQDFLKIPVGSTSSCLYGSTENGVGLYRPFADHAWSKLEEMEWFEEDTSVPEELASNTAPAKGFPEGSQVRMTVKALRPKSKDSIVRYARYALLESIVPSDKEGDDTFMSTDGIQVLNLVVFPSSKTNLPVFGADMVSLPGGKHLLLLDAQPMDMKTKDDQVLWLEWFKTHVLGKDPDVANFPWGGDFPPEVKKYVSEYCLWSRLSGEEAVPKIQKELWPAFKEHLDLYLIMLSSYFEKKELENEQEPYIEYRLNNDPAKPMLKSLYGEEWTNRVLKEVLFPSK